MILYLRDSNNGTVVDIEVYQKCISDEEYKWLCKSYVDEIKNLYTEQQIRSEGGGEFKFSIEHFSGYELPEKNYAELRSVVVVQSYSKLLLSLPQEEQEECINIFQVISELRGWLWEVYKVSNKNCNYMEVVGELRPMLKEVAKKYKLEYRED